MQAVNAEVRGLAGAVAFLTRVPVGRWVALDADDVSRGGALFPLVGAGIGAVVGGLADALAGPLTPALGALLGVAAGAALTGALHLDALADTADALGAYGAAAVVLDLGVKIAALAALGSGRDALRFAVCAAAAARVVPVALSAALPYARSGGGTGRVLGGAGWGRCVAALAVAAGFCVWLHTLPLLAVATGTAVVAGLVAHRWLGGVTGDVLGAAAELAEAAALVTAVALV